MGKVLITGGAGFIGSHLCDRLLAEGHSVTCVDNFLSGSRDNIAQHAANPNFRLIEHDVIQDLPTTITGEKYDAIFHFASPASPNPDSPVSYINHPVETLMVNSLGTKHLLDLATRNHCQIILASTSEVYGDPAVHPQPETYWGNVSPNGTRSCYDEAKRFLEAIAFTYYRNFKTPIKVIRIFNTYGPRLREDDGRFSINLVLSALRHLPFKIYGDGTSTRSFCYIDDLVDGILAVFGSDQAVGEVINLGNAGEYTVQDSIKLAETLTGSPLELVHLPALPDDPTRRQPDLSKAKSLLFWEPKIDFPTGLQKMLTYYQNQSSK